MAAAMTRDSTALLGHSGLKFRPKVLYFWTPRGDTGRESSEKYRANGQRVAGSDSLVHKRTEHAFASRVRVRDQQQHQLPDDCQQARALVFRFRMAPDRV